MTPDSSKNAPDPNTVSSKEALPSEHGSTDKPSPAPAPASNMKDHEQPKNGAGTRLKGLWKSLDIDVPTVLMMLKWETLILIVSSGEAREADDNV
jgi:hypothetical protein